MKYCIDFVEVEVAVEVAVVAEVVVVDLGVVGSVVVSVEVAVVDHDFLVGNTFFKYSNYKINEILGSRSSSSSGSRIFSRN